MQLKSLSLHTFRNYNHLELHLHPQMNLFIGKNGQGKTNILEACHLLATARSHRGAKDSELVKWGEREYHLGAQIVTRYGSQTINLHYNPQQGRKGQVNGSWLPRLLDLIGNLKLVFFAPEHLSLVKGDPGQRRRFLDILFSQLSKQYLYNLSQYNRVLREKNTLLKSEPREYQLLEVYNQQLAELGAAIIMKRLTGIELLKELAAKYHLALHSEEQLLISYESQLALEPPYSLGKIAKELAELQQLKQSEELRRGFCVVGVQRDDLNITLSGMDARKYASQGQQRSLVLALKAAEAHYIEIESGEKPILVLDDLLSELDSERQANLLQQLSGFGQTLISATALPAILQPYDKAIYKVEGGKAEKAVYAD